MGDTLLPSQAASMAQKVGYFVGSAMLASLGSQTSYSQEAFVADLLVANAGVVKLLGTIHIDSSDQ